MSGHSKWSNIKRKKEKTDAAKAKIFTKIGREIAVVVKAGGANPNENSKLKDAIAKAELLMVDGNEMSAAVEAAKIAAEQVSGVVTTHILTRTEPDTEPMLKLNAFDKN